MKQNTYFTSLCETKEDKLVPPSIKSDQGINGSLWYFVYINKSYGSPYFNPLKFLITRGKKLFCILLSWPLYQMMIHYDQIEFDFLFLFHRVLFFVLFLDVFLDTQNIT